MIRNKSNNYKYNKQPYLMQSNNMSLFNIIVTTIIIFFTICLFILFLKYFIFSNNNLIDNFINNQTSNNRTNELIPINTNIILKPIPTNDIITKIKYKTITNITNLDILDNPDLIIISKEELKKYQKENEFPYIEEINHYRLDPFIVEYIEDKLNISLYERQASFKVKYNNYKKYSISPLIGYNISSLSPVIGAEFNYNFNETFSAGGGFIGTTIFIKGSFSF